MQAPRATLGGLPAAMRRWWQACSLGLTRVAVRAAMESAVQTWSRSPQQLRRPRQAARAPRELRLHQGRQLAVDLREGRGQRGGKGAKSRSRWARSWRRRWRSAVRSATSWGRGGPHRGRKPCQHVRVQSVCLGQDAVVANALADVLEAGQLLGVQVEQLAGLGALLMHDGRPGDPGAAGADPAPLRWRAARISASASGLTRQGCRCGMDGRSRSSRQPPSRKRAHQR